MNYPSQKQSDDKPDLRFSSKDPNKIFEQINEKEATTKNTVQDKNITVISYDYGSYGKLNADVTMEDGTKIETHLLDKEETINFMSIPFDENYNDIADKWEENAGILNDKLPPNWDEEKIGSPNKNYGDGITLYEEYRGFAIAKDNALQYIKLNPKRQELFLRAKSKYKAEIAKAFSNFTKNSNIDIVDVGDDKLLEMVPNENATTSFATEKINRWANFNRNDDGKHSAEHEVCCISIIDYPKKVGTPAKSVLLKDDEDSYDDQKISPNNFWAIVFNFDEVSKTFSGLKQYLPPFVDFNEPAQFKEDYSKAFYASIDVLKKEFNTTVDINSLSGLIDSRLDALTKQLITLAVTHEICHVAGNVVHHANDIRMKEGTGAKVRLYTDASLPIFSQPTGQKWFYTGDPNCYTHYFCSPRFAHYLTLAIMGKWDMGSNIGANGEPMIFCKDPYDKCFQRLNLTWKQ